VTPSVSRPVGGGTRKSAERPGQQGREAHPRTFLPSLDTLLYGFDPDTGALLLATEPALWELALKVAAFELVFCSTWDEIRSSLTGIEDPLDAEVLSVLAVRLDSAYSELRDPDDPPERPDGWWPPQGRLDDRKITDVLIDESFYLGDTPGLEQLGHLGLPDEIAAFGRTEMHRLGPDVTEFSPEVLPAVIATARRLGIGYVRSRRR